MSNQTCKTVGTPKACQNSAQRYPLTLAPTGADLVLLAAIVGLLWIA